MKKLRTIKNMGVLSAVVVAPIVLSLGAGTKIQDQSTTSGGLRSSMITSDSIYSDKKSHNSQNHTSFNSQYSTESLPFDIWFEKLYDLDEFSHGSTWFTHHHTHFKIKLAILDPRWKIINFQSKTMFNKGKRVPMVSETLLINNGSSRQTKTVDKVKKYADKSMLVHLDDYESHLLVENDGLFYEGSYDRAYRSWQKGIYYFVLQTLADFKVL